MGKSGSFGGKFFLRYDFWIGFSVNFGSVVVFV